MLDVRGANRELPDNEQYDPIGDHLRFQSRLSNFDFDVGPAGSLCEDLDIQFQRDAIRMNRGDANGMNFDRRFILLLEQFG